MRPERSEYKINPARLDSPKGIHGDILRALRNLTSESFSFSTFHLIDSAVADNRQRPRPKRSTSRTRLWYLYTQGYLLKRDDEASPWTLYFESENLPIAPALTPEPATAAPLDEPERAESLLDEAIGKYFSG